MKVGGGNPNFKLGRHRKATFTSRQMAYNRGEARSMRGWKSSGFTKQRRFYDEKRHRSITMEEGINHRPEKTTAINGQFLRWEVWDSGAIFSGPRSGGDRKDVLQGRVPHSNDKLGLSLQNQRKNKALKGRESPGRGDQSHETHEEPLG